MVSRLRRAFFAPITLKAATALITLLLLGAIREPALAQSITDQIETVSDTVTELTNNINAFGAAMFAVIVVVVFMGIDRFRERSAAARKEEAEAETRRLLAEERRDDAERQAAERVEQREITKQFNVLIRASKLNTHQMAENIGKMATGLESLVGQMSLDREANAGNIQKIIAASETRYKGFLAQMTEFQQAFQKTQTDNLEAFGERIAAEISTSQDRSVEYFTQIHRDTLLEMKAMDSSAMDDKEVQRIAAATVKAINDLGLLKSGVIVPDPGGEPQKIVTGPLIEKETNNETPTPPHPDTQPVDPGTGTDAGADGSADAGDSAK